MPPTWTRPGPSCRHCYTEVGAPAEIAPGGRGDKAFARRELHSALDLARTHGFAYTEVQVISTIALLAASDCDYGQMVGAAEEAIRAASRRGRASVGVDGPGFGRARVRRSARRQPVQRATVGGERLGHRSRPDAAGSSLRPAGYVHGAACADEGDRAAGFGEMQLARANGSGMLRGPPPVPAALAVLEHRVVLLHGNLGAAADVVAWLERRVGRVAEVLLMEALAALASGRPEAARTAVEPVLSESLPVLLPQAPIIEALLIAAEGALRGKDVAAGTAVLGPRPAAGATAGHRQAVRTGGSAHPEPPRQATRGAPGQARSRPTSLRLGRPCSPRPPAPLSDRELVVVALLPSLLSAGEIAVELTVSVNTVKSHIRSIYTKLGASSRREAVQRAQERGLLQ